MYPIVGLCGKAGTGKDTIANILVEAYGGTKIAFADPMKALAERYFPHDNVYGSSEKRNEPVVVNFTSRFSPSHPLAVFEARVSDTIGADKPLPVHRFCTDMHQYCIDNFGRMSARYFLQRLGTELGRTVDPELWSKKAMRTADSLLLRYPFVIISDVRFQNEALAIKRAGGVLVRIDGVGVATTDDSHASETEQASIPDFWFDQILVNPKDGLGKLQFRVKHQLSPMNLFTGRGLGA